MKTLVSLFLGLFVAAGLSGCSNTSPYLEEGSATISSARTTNSDTDAVPALVWTIDGERVPLISHDHQVRPGTHSFSVVPRQGGPILRTLNYGKWAERRGINIAEITVDLEAGQEIVVAAVIRRHRTYVGEGDARQPLQPWQTTIVPHIVTTDL